MECMLATTSRTEMLSCFLKIFELVSKTFGKDTSFFVFIIMIMMATIATYLVLHKTVLVK